MTRIEQFGWRGAAAPGIGRVVSAHGDYYHLVCNAKRTSQTLADNFDTLFIMMSLNENFSIPRLERYLTLAEDIGEAKAVVILPAGAVVIDMPCIRTYGFGYSWRENAGGKDTVEWQKVFDTRYTSADYKFDNLGVRVSCMLMSDVTAAQEAAAAAQ